MVERKAYLSMADTPRNNRPLSLNELFDKAITQLPLPRASISPSTSVPPSGRTNVTDGFLFSGNHHDSVPRALLQDKRLTPLERNAWQVLRLLHTEDGISAFPTYEQLAPWLASMPCTDRASHETVARALTLLRLTRWISLVRRRRDPTTGRILGNLYVLHDEPLTLYEAIQLDQDYLGLISTALSHASKSLQRIGVHTLKALSEDPQLIGKALPSRIQILLQRLNAQDGATHECYPQADDAHESEEGQKGLLRNSTSPTSGSELSSKAPEIKSLRDPKNDSTVSIKTVKNVRTPSLKSTELRLPKRFTQLKPEQQSGAWAALQTVDPELHQAILDEWDTRCRKSTVRNAAGDLFGIIQKALRGEFQPWAGQQSDALTEPRATLTPTKPDTVPTTSREEAQAHIKRLRKMLGHS